jgi:hypothetical protein
MAQAKRGLEELAAAFERCCTAPGGRAAIGVTDGEAARILRALEYGSVPGAPPWPSPGPRTLLSTDPETAAPAIFSRLAPQGFLRVRAAELAQMLRRQLETIEDWLDPAQLQSGVDSAPAISAAQFLTVLRQGLPEHFGRLAQHLTVVREAERDARR